MSELAGYAGFYFSEQVSIDPALAAKELNDEGKARLAKLRERFAALPNFSATELEQALKSLAAELGIKAGPLVHPTRVAVTGATAGPSLYHLLEILGRDRVLQRMDAALAM